MSDTENNPVGALQDDPKLALRERAVDYLNKLWADRPSPDCPICGSNSWGINDVSLLPVRETASAGSHINESSRVYPLVPINCHTCGYMFFLNELWIRENGIPSALKAQLDAREQDGSSS
jgi:hypothetical protein